MPGVLHAHFLQPVHHQPPHSLDQAHHFRRGGGLLSHLTRNSGSRYFMARGDDLSLCQEEGPQCQGQHRRDVGSRCWVSETLMIVFFFFLMSFSWTCSEHQNSRGSSCAFSSCPAWKSHQILVPKLSLCPSFQSEGECYDPLLCSDYCCDKQAGTTESSRDNVKVDNFCGPTAGSFTIWQGLQHIWLQFNFHQMGPRSLWSMKFLLQICPIKDMQIENNAHHFPCHVPVRLAQWVLQDGPFIHGGPITLNAPFARPGASAQPWKASGKHWWGVLREVQLSPTGAPGEGRFGGQEMGEMGMVSVKICRDTCAMQLFLCACFLGYDVWIYHLI